MGDFIIWLFCFRASNHVNQMCRRISKTHKRYIWIYNSKIILRKLIPKIISTASKGIIFDKIFNVNQLLVIHEVLYAHLQMKLIISLSYLISLIFSHYVRIYHIISSLWRTDIPPYLFIVANRDTTLFLHCGERRYHIIFSLWRTDIPHYLFVVANGYTTLSFCCGERKTLNVKLLWAVNL
jgi:hypothetical protein